MSGVTPARSKQYFPNSSGGPLANGTVDVFLAGTTTRVDSYQDKALTILNTNPITLNSRGECTIWLSSSATYKFVVKDSGGGAVYTEDNVSGGGGSGSSDALTFWDYMTGAERTDALLASPVLDHTASMQAAITAAPAGSVIEGTAGATFKFTNLTSTKRLTLDFKGASLIVDPTPVGVTTGTPAIFFSGALGTSYAISTVASLTNQVTLATPADAANFAAGDYVLLQDQKVVPMWDASATAYTGRFEPNRVVSVSGANLRLECPVEWLYDTTPVVQKMTMLDGPAVLNIGSLTEVDPGGDFTGPDIETAPHLIQFKMCVAPRVENVKASRYNLHAVNFHKCIKPLARNIEAHEALRPNTGGQGYMLRFSFSRSGLCSQSKGTRLRHMVDFCQAYDCVSTQNVAAYPLNVAFIWHGLGERRCMSIDDSGFSGEANSFVNPWGVGNPAFAGAYDTRIIRPKMRGAWVGVIVGYKSENTEIIEPDFVFSSVGVGNSSRGVIIVSGAKATAVRGGVMDLSQCSGSAGDHAIMARYNVGAGAPQTIAPDSVRVEGVRILGGTLSDRIIAISNTVGEVYLWGNELHNASGVGIPICIENTPTSIIIEDNWLFGNADKGIRVATAASPYRVVNNRGSATYATSFLDLAVNLALIEVMNSETTDQTFPNLRITGAAATVRSLNYQTARVDRFLLRVNNDAEGGANAGSDFEIARRADDGTALGTSIKVVRATSQLEFEAGDNFTRPIKLGSRGFLWVDSTTRLRIKATAPTGDTDGTVIGTQV